MNSAITFAFVIGVIISGICAFFGILLGIIFAIVSANSKDKKQKATYKKVMIWCFAGLGVFVAIFVLYFLLNVIFQFTAVAQH